MKPGRRKRVVPQPGGESFQLGEAGPLTYTYPMPPVKSRGRLISLGGDLVSEPGERQDSPQLTRPLIPTTEEIAELPREARTAFSRRCAVRVAPLFVHVPPVALGPFEAIHLKIDEARIDTPIRRQILCIRRDFDRLVHLARKHNWTDDTPVPPEVFGPLWPKNLVPDWAKEPPTPAQPEPSA